jgi:CRP-like cAMP-binding protein
VALNPKQYPPALDLLKQIDFLEGVGEESYKTLLVSIQYQQFPEFATILRQGEIANQLYIVCRGSVEITTKNKGQVIPLATLKPPMYFGEISLLTPSSATATVKAGEGGANVLLLSHEALESLLTKKIPDIKQRIQKVIDARLEAKRKAKEADNKSEDEQAA